MAEKKRFLLRLDEQVWAGMERWADDELRSVNAQIEFALKEALKRSGRWPAGPGAIMAAAESASAPDDADEN